MLLLAVLLLLVVVVAELFAVAVLLSRVLVELVGLRRRPGPSRPSTWPVQADPDMTAEVPGFRINRPYS